MRPVPHIVPLLLTMLGCLSPVASDAQEALEGTYTFVADSSTNIDDAIDAAVTDMNFIKRPIARSRLKKTNPIYRRIVIAKTPQEISVEFRSGAPVSTPADGTSVKWTRDDGEVFDVSATWEGSALAQRFKAEDGERLNVFRLTPDGRMLTLDVTVSSDQLPKPMTYSLVYRRVS
jgi:hypothetical protein